MKDFVVEIEPNDLSDSEREEIFRNLLLLYGTTAGELALDRDFGISAEITDVPQNLAQPLLTAEYVRKTERYEPRAEVVRVDWVADSADSGKIKPKVVVEIV